MQSIIIEGELINLSSIAHVYYKEEIHKSFKHYVYLHFTSGARTYFRYEQQSDATGLLIFILERFGEVDHLPEYCRKGFGRGQIVEHIDKRVEK